MITLNKIVIAYNAESEMVSFYNNVFNTNLTLVKVGEYNFYRGAIAGIKLIFCPNRMLGIKADKNNIQLSFTVNNLMETVDLVKKNGGKQLEKIEESEENITVGVIDPDGNTIELMEILK